MCVGFQCLDTFDYRNITEWTDDGATALCPSCGIDSVIGTSSGYPAGDVAFLRAMHLHWLSVGRQ